MSSSDSKLVFVAYVINIITINEDQGWIMEERFKRIW